jgi:hypothetical protein
MTIDRVVMFFAGLIALLSAVLTAFVGANLMQASVTGFCPAAMIAKALGAKPGCAFQ